MRCLLVVLILLGCDDVEKPKQANTGLEAKAEQPLAYITDLPIGTSDIESIDVEVQGDATHYKYAFLTDASVACEDAEYGDFHPLSTRLQLDLGENGAKIICLIGKDSDGNEQKKAERYQWVKVSVAIVHTDGPEVNAVKPLAYTTGLPTGTSDITSIDVEVQGNATHYKYAFMTDTSVACEDAEYGNFLPLSTRLQLDLGENGDKVICLIGKDSNNNEQEKPERYQWERISVSVTQVDVSLEQADVNDDGKIDELDLTFVRDNQGKTITATNRAADVDENRVIDHLDIAAVGYRFGGEKKCFTPSSIERADVNDDLVINIFDLVFVGQRQGKNSLTTAEDKKADVCEDGRIGMVDLAAVSYWFGGEGCPHEVELSRTDTNTDGVINIFDLVFVASHYGKTSLTTVEEEKADVCEDGVVGMRDLHTISSNFAKVAP